MEEVATYPNNNNIIESHDLQVLAASQKDLNANANTNETVECGNNANSANADHENVSDPSLSCHDKWRIALYYIYIELTAPSQVESHIDAQRKFCEQHGLKGRIRVSTEGVNGVLSGTLETLRAYEHVMSMTLQEAAREQGGGEENQNTPFTILTQTTNTSTFDTTDASTSIAYDEGQQNDKDNEATSIDLDVKYCRLRKDLPIEKQLFDRLVIKKTKNIIGLFDESLCGQHQQQQLQRSKSERYRRKRERKRKEQEKHRHTKQQQQLQQQSENSPSQCQQQGPIFSFAATISSTNNEVPSPNRNNDASDDKDLQQQQDDDAAQLSPSRLDLSALRRTVMEEPLNPARHLSAAEWNEKLDALSISPPPSSSSSSSSKKKSALLLDVRNVYEMKVGYFAHPSTPTLLTNTRKYSDLPKMLATNRDVQERDQIFMYCTGGVRCERVSMLVRELYPDKEIFQLQGGIQRYLETCAEQQQEQQRNQQPHNDQQQEGISKNTNSTAAKNNPGYFVGKNFVFDPRRTDPTHFGETVGRCLVCEKPHDDYDNGHAPSENKETRCNNCRMLILICNDCRSKYRCHGEKQNGDDDDQGETIASTKQKDSCSDDTIRPLLYCNLDKCIHEGSSPDPELRVFTK